jgi:rhamnulokinase
MGLWLVQECKRTWARQGENLTYDELTRLAAEARPFLAVIDPDDSNFLHPDDMPAHIQAYCQRTRQPIPQTKGEIVRVVLESIALKYRWVLERLEDVTGTCLEPLHIIGGGIKNHLLNQFAADATGCTVITGPDEATAIGNILMQAIALGHLSTLDKARSIVRHSFEQVIFEPGGRDAWDEAFARLLDLLGGTE